MCNREVTWSGKMVLKFGNSEAYILYRSCHIQLLEKMMSQVDCITSNKGILETLKKVYIYILSWQVAYQVRRCPWVVVDVEQADFLKTEYWVQVRFKCKSKAFLMRAAIASTHASFAAVCIFRRTLLTHCLMIMIKYGRLPMQSHVTVQHCCLHLQKDPAYTLLNDND